MSEFDLGAWIERYILTPLQESALMALLGLAVLTLLARPELAATGPMVSVSVTAAVFALVLLGTRCVNLGNAGPMREIVVFGVT